MLEKLHPLLKTTVTLTSAKFNNLLAFVHDGLLDVLARLGRCGLARPFEGGGGGFALFGRGEGFGVNAGDFDVEVDA